MANTGNKSGKRKSRQQRLRERHKARTVQAEVVRRSTSPETDDSAPSPADVDRPAESAEDQDEVVSHEETPDHEPPTEETAIQQVEATPKEPEGFVGKLVGSGRPEVDGDTGLVHYRQKPGLLRPFARRAYQRDATLASIKNGFDNLSDLMGDIRDGLDDSVERQGELLEQLQWLPTVARQNADNAKELREQFSRSNDLAGEHLKLQSESLRTQAESVKALRDQINGQRQQSDKLNDVLGKMSRESRDQKREVDDLQVRLDKMRESDQSIADNLGGVAGALRHVSERTAAQGEVIVKMQQTIDERTRRLEEETAKRSRSQSLLVVLSLLLAVAALGAVAAVGYLYLRETGTFG
ncbi:MAG: hypothetical protein AAGI46_01495 [Planctomycetota bacterium]